MSLCIVDLMEKDNCDLDSQPPKQKAKHTKVVIDKRFAEVKVQMRWQKLLKDMYF